LSKMASLRFSYRLASNSGWKVQFAYLFLGYFISHKRTLPYDKFPA
jgi:hypothetical protein